jgi:hypothetical protein
MCYALCLPAVGRRSAYLVRSDEEGPKFGPFPRLQEFLDRDKPVLFFPRIDNDAFSSITDHHHKMILLINEKPLIHQNDQGIA